ncbi:hypothetical protein AAVH_27398 [Aphelenchoides avenae]|nr:hypothetical protein AAVH_27398 [Aphelenchus avenae]
MYQLRKCTPLKRALSALQQSGRSGRFCEAFVGLRSDNAGQFASWLDGSPFGESFYSNWNSGEPNNVGYREMERRSIVHRPHSGVRDLPAPYNYVTDHNDHYDNHTLNN